MADTSRILKELDSTTHAIVTLKAKWGLTQREIADVFGVSDARIGQKLDEIRRPKKKPPLPKPRLSHINAGVDGDIPEDAYLCEIEAVMIILALKRNGWNRTHTAKALGVSLRTIRNKVKEYRELGLSISECMYGMGNLWSKA